MVQAAFLELGTPGLEEAADILVTRGVDRIVVVPYFLTPGLHMERDLPPLVDNILKKHKDIEVLVAASLDGHPGLIQALADRARDASLSPKL
jgi:sirohydrochlorin ferrochelatase